MNKLGRPSVSAFTIFEVTVVLAIMSVLIAIISTSMNRFNEQLKISTEVHDELNHWWATRSVIWNDFYMADSIQFQAGELTLYNSVQTTLYKIQDDQLQRSFNDQWTNLEIESESISAEEKDGSYSYHIHFPWKGESMDLSYHFQAGIDIKMNAYFDRLN